LEAGGARSPTDDNGDDGVPGDGAASGDGGARGGGVGLGGDGPAAGGGGGGGGGGGVPGNAVAGAAGHQAIVGLPSYPRRLWSELRAP
jgi:hypothetical protein